MLENLNLKEKYHATLSRCEQSLEAFNKVVLSSKSFEEINAKRLDMLAALCDLVSDSKWYVFQLEQEVRS